MPVNGRTVMGPSVLVYPYRHIRMYHEPLGEREEERKKEEEEEETYELLTGGSHVRNE